MAAGIEPARVGQALKDVCEHFRKSPAAKHAQPAQQSAADAMIFPKQLELSREGFDECCNRRNRFHLKLHEPKIAGAIHWVETNGEHRFWQANKDLVA